MFALALVRSSKKQEKMGCVKETLQNGAAFQLCGGQLLGQIRTLGSDMRHTQEPAITVAPERYGEGERGYTRFWDNGQRPFLRRSIRRPCLRPLSRTLVYVNRAAHH